ncbi:MAG: LysR family transcriptional regulator substrate-binding protein [Coriobacteriales bacterium]
MKQTFAVSGQHYLFSVQAFASVVLSNGGEDYSYAFRNTTTRQTIDDVSSGHSELGVLLETSATRSELEQAFDEAGVDFVKVVESAPRVALPASHPLINAESLSLDQLEDFPYVYFEQEDGVSAAFAEEALADVARNKLVACTDRASLSELIAALNGYTVTSGILVGISDGKGLATVPLESDVTLELGYLKRKNAPLSDSASKFIKKLTQNLERYARK